MKALRFFFAGVVIACTSYSDVSVASPISGQIALRLNVPVPVQAHTRNGTTFPSLDSLMLLPNADSLCPIGYLPPQQAH